MVRAGCVFFCVFFFCFFFLLSFTRLGHERQDLLSLCDEMHVHAERNVFAWKHFQCHSHPQQNFVKNKPVKLHDLDNASAINTHENNNISFRVKV